MRFDRERPRAIGATASALMAVIYYLIGLGVLRIGGSSTGDPVDLVMFGASAGTGFLVLAVLLLRTDRRWVWMLAAVAQVWVFLVYFLVSGSREPPFEAWGIVLRLLQVPLFVVTVLLAWRPAARGTTGTRPA